VDTWRIIPFARGDAFENMAIDEAIFRMNQQKDMPPTLRLYGWKKQAVSLGYFQDADREIQRSYCRDRDIDIVRRPTGGKAVLHGNDLTYSLVGRGDNPLFSPDIIETYRIISECLLRGLAKSGVEARMVEEGRIGDASSDAFCFAASYKNELLSDGKKICGSAQVRARGVFLQHGSILIDFDPAAVRAAIIANDTAMKADTLNARVSSIRRSIGETIGMDTLCRNIASGFEEVLKVRLIEGRLSPEEERLKDRLLKNKYKTARWNAGRGTQSGH